MHFFFFQVLKSYLPFSYKKYKNKTYQKRGQEVSLLKMVVYEMKNKAFFLYDDHALLVTQCVSDLIRSVRGQ